MYRNIGRAGRGSAEFVRSALTRRVFLYDGMWMRPVLREKGISDDIMYKNNHSTTVQRCNYAYRDNGCALRGSAEFVRSALTRRVFLYDGMWMRAVIRETGISDVIFQENCHSTTVLPKCNYAYRDNGCALRGSAEFVRSTLTRRVLLEDGMWMRPVIRKTGISDVIMYKELSQYHSPTMKLRISRQWLRLAWIC